MAKDINSIQSGVVKENDVNNPSVQTYRGKNQFPQSFQHLSTAQYGYIDPVAVAKCTTGDVFPYKFVADLNTFTLKSPLKTPVKMYSAAFKVPLEAIYPKTYDLLFSFAQKGDQVPQDSPSFDGNLGTYFMEDSARSIFYFNTFMRRLLITQGEWLTEILQPYSLDSVKFNCYIRSWFLAECLLSAGSLFSKMNMHFNAFPLVVSKGGNPVVSDISFDKAFDLYFYPMFKDLVEHSRIYIMHYSGGTDEPEGYPIYLLTTDATKYNKVYVDTADEFDTAVYYGSIDRAFELLRTGEWNVYISPDTENASFASALDVLNRHSLSIFPNDNIINQRDVVNYVNIEPVIAYQLACIHFFNNPKIDYLYTADLWRDNLYSIVKSVVDYPTFDYNGTEILYDVTSFSVIRKMITVIKTHPEAFFGYFFNLFTYQRSLRYGDYFVGSRPEPIGVGDINLDENSSGSIDSLEVARKLQLTRLLHKVAITGPEHSQQIKYIFGGRLPDVPKDVPIRLSLEEFDVSGFEVNNTGEAQLDSDIPNITTTNLRLSDSKFMFEVEVNEPCWLVMVQYFEAHRVYANTFDRMAFHYDLYDDFVPDMQFIGDQEVYQAELLGVYGSPYVPFSYHLRNMEYKQRTSYASGGFIEFLPSWAFITDNNEGNPAYGNITPEYIRSSPSEFDRFYKSLLGHSLGSRFHFITANTNVMAPYRQMVYAPEILA